MRVNLAAIAATVLLSAAPAFAQTAPTAPVQVPLQAIPYSPSLDLTDMDRTIDPCVDFYKYACGGWQKKNPIPADQASWSVYAKLANDNQQFLWGILQNAAVAKDRNAAQQKIGDYFAACMDTAAIDKAGIAPIQKILDLIKGLDTRDAIIASIAVFHHNLPGSYFFNSGTDQDAIDSSTIIAEVGAGGLGLPDRDYYLKTDAKSVEIRRQYITYIVTMLLAAGENEDQVRDHAMAVINIETALAKASLSRVDRRDPHKTYHKLTIAELQALAPAIDWPDYFIKQAAPAFTSLNVEQPEFMKAVQTELIKEPVESLQAYLRFHLMTAAAPSLGHTYQQAQFDFFSTTLRGVPAMPPRWKQCTRQVDRALGEALGQEFVRLTFSADMKARTQLMTGQIETAMQHEIEALDWMGPETKKEALRKLHAIRNKIGYPDTWRDYSLLLVKPDDYFGNVLRAAAFEDAREWNKLGKPVDLNEWGMTPPTVRCV